MVLAIIKELKALAYSFLRRVAMRNSFSGVRFGNNVSLRYDNKEYIKFGRGVTVGSFSEIVVLTRPEFSPVSGELIVDDNVVVNAFANIRATGGRIEIHSDALLAQHVSLIASNHTFHPTVPYRLAPWDNQRTGVVIEKNVWVGAGAIILPGVTIGTNSIVGAGSVVRESIPCNQVWAGVPARFIRFIEVELQHR